MAGRPATKKVEEVKNDTVNEELVKQNKMLQDQLAMMQEQMNKLFEMQNKPQQTANTSMDRWVDIVHLREVMAEGASTHIETPSRTIDFYKYGETRSIRFNEFQELVGKYRSWFEKGIITLSAKDSDLAIKEGLLTEENFTLKREQITNLPELSLTELEELYNRVPDSQKLFITRMWAYGYYEVGGSYKNVTKVELLNRLSNGAMTNILNDLMTNR